MCLEGDVSYATHVLSHQQAANIQEYDCQPKMDKKLQKYKILWGLKVIKTKIQLSTQQNVKETIWMPFLGTHEKSWQIRQTEKTELDEETEKTR